MTTRLITYSVALSVYESLEKAGRPLARQPGNRPSIHAAIKWHAQGSKQTGGLVRAYRSASTTSQS